MKRSIAGQSIVGYVLALSAAAAAAGCAEDGPPSDQAALAAVETSSLVQSDAGGLLQVRCPHGVPAALNPPADATLAAALPARGVQIYTCAIPSAGGAPAWTLKAPHAVLGKGHDVQAIHFAGPSWQAVDGSVVTGTKIAASPRPMQPTSRGCCCRRRRTRARACSRRSPGSSAWTPRRARPPRPAAMTRTWARRCWRLTPPTTFSIARRPTASASGSARRGDRDLSIAGSGAAACRVGGRGGRAVRAAVGGGLVRA